MTRRGKNRAIIQKLFKDEKGNGLVLTESQLDVFDSIFLKDNNRVQIIAPTQYGKSNTVAMALILRSQMFKEDWMVLTGQEKKSEVIMSKVISHTFDNRILLDNLEFDKNEPLERIKRERSKRKITWKTGGSITAITADSRNRKRVNESLSGLGCGQIVEDEASLIPDDLQAMVLRMLGGYNGGTLIKIGNPYTRGHFYKTWNSPKYKKIFIDYQIGLKEGRYTNEFIEEMREEPFFSILYECKFPEENEIDLQGYHKTFLKINRGKIEHKGVIKMGVDVGEGGDETSIVLRSEAFAEVLFSQKLADLMQCAKIVIDYIKQKNVLSENVFIDRVGVGAGVYSRLREIGYNVTGIKWGEKGEEQFANLKAENFYKASKWNGVYDEKSDWSELEIIKHKEDSSGKMKIKSKEELRKEGIASPNIADSFAMTFNKSIEEQAPKIRVI
jgi:hypothetical protein